MNVRSVPFTELQGHFEAGGNNPLKSSWWWKKPLKTCPVAAFWSVDLRQN